MLNKTKKIVSLIDQFGFCFSVSMLTILTIAAVFSRYILSKPLMWAEEVQMILIVWCVYFGGSIAFRERGHIAIDVFYEKYPKTIQIILDVLTWLIVAGSIIWIGKLQLDRTITMFQKHNTTSILEIPRCITYGVVTFACFLMFISHVICGIEDIQNRKAMQGGDMK